VLGAVIVADDQTTEAADPCVRPLDLPALSVTTKRPAILDAQPTPVLAVRDDEFDPAPPQTFPKWVAVIGAIGDHPRRLGPRPPRPVPGDLDRRERGLEERDFSW